MNVFLGIWIGISISCIIIGVIGTNMEKTCEEKNDVYNCIMIFVPENSLSKE